MSNDNAKKRGAPPHHFIDDDWLALRDEPVLEPERPIVDPHHHLWDRPHHRYLLPELLADLDTGHHVRGTVFVECSSMYRADGDARFACVGEVEFVNGIAAMSASGVYGPVRACAGIVGKVDLTLGGFAEEVLQACAARAPDRFRGIRQMAAWDTSPEVSTLLRPPPKDLLQDAKFREGYAVLGRMGLSFDAWVYHPQLPQLIELVDAVPATPVVLNHLGGRAGLGPYAGRHDDVFREWKASIQALAERPNVSVKLGGIGMRLGGFDFHERPLPPTSEELAEAWSPYVQTCIEAFGPSRAMFESNFPVDKSCCTYRVLWNAFKRLAEGFSEDEKTDLFAGSAVRAYRLPQALTKAAP
ncbi:putative metal-dependent hydrolase of the TIM-barrel fold protein [Variovorax sp. PBL-H6]|uniref:amidohydrolase family protein n=1 Tax=Variovorax sp. PBL-H6 TaxID=434009 RepID=UPI0013162194|nr:amidohydrolase family protein [Variovorax sp. PBL-H6]VTU31961.1 putative metal-dependent hydrolase of the TIM-barrel fold protein [Variovorax sp. PBL-H6]